MYLPPIFSCSFLSNNMQVPERINFNPTLLESGLLSLRTLRVKKWGTSYGKNHAAKVSPFIPLPPIHVSRSTTSNSSNFDYASSIESLMKLEDVSNFIDGLFMEINHSSNSSQDVIQFENKPLELSLPFTPPSTPRKSLARSLVKETLVRSLPRSSPRLSTNESLSSVILETDTPVSVISSFVTENQANSSSNKLNMSLVRKLSEMNSLHNNVEPLQSSSEFSKPLEKEINTSNIPLSTLNDVQVEENHTKTRSSNDVSRNGIDWDGYSPIDESDQRSFKSTRSSKSIQKIKRGFSSILKKVKSLLIQ